MRRCAFAILVPLLLAPAAASASSQYLDTRWTKAAAAADSIAGPKQRKSLPEMRIYDSRARLIYRGFGAKAGSTGATISRALRASKPVAGPSFAETMNELETRDGKPALAQASGKAHFTIVDYWADWCAPCKILSKELDVWAARQPPGAVQIVRAETDPIAASRAKGNKIILLKKGPDGTLIKTEVK